MDSIYSGTEIVLVVMAGVLTNVAHARCEGKEKKEVAPPALLAPKHYSHRYCHFVGGYAQKPPRFIYSTPWNFCSRPWNVWKVPLPVTAWVQEVQEVQVEKCE